MALKTVYFVKLPKHLSASYRKFKRTLFKARKLPRNKNFFVLRCKHSRISLYEWSLPLLLKKPNSIMTHDKINPTNILTPYAIAKISAVVQRSHWLLLFRVIKSKQWQSRSLWRGAPFSNGDIPACSYHVTSGSNRLLGSGCYSPSPNRRRLREDGWTVLNLLLYWYCWFY